jgi:GNAT superfamily N-acetyltransferase
VRHNSRRVGNAELAQRGDIPALNRLFSDAFTERYRRDGMTNLRVPYLNPAIWQYSIDNAGTGAFIWRDGGGDIVAFNMCHCSGTEGWMGPIAVRVDRQGVGLGSRIVEEGVAWLKQSGATTIGLETMPRTVENIGFYSGLGFVPGRLTFTLQTESDGYTAGSSISLSELSSELADQWLLRCNALTQLVVPGSDYSREARLSCDHRLGDLTLITDGDELVAFAIWHAVALANSRSAEELRVLKLVARDLASARRLLDVLSNHAKRLKLPHISIRCQSAHDKLYSELVCDGWRVQWTDLRMTLRGYAEAKGVGIVLTNWEI